MYKGLKKIARLYLNSVISSSYKKQYNNLLKRNNIPNKPCPDEEKWVEKWSALGKPNPIYYRLFSHYIGNDLNIIPEDICRNIVEPILDPTRYRPYYSDKNIFDKLFKEGTMPLTLFRKMNGFYYDAAYNDLRLENDGELKSLLNSHNLERIVIKPSVDSSSGNGVKLFQRKENEWVEIGGTEILSLAYLAKNYGPDFIVQECLQQADYMGYYNPTSVNTLRLTLYRSVKDNECYIPSAIIRIGGKGSLVDNAHAGGGYVGINSDGTLCKKVLNQYGESLSVFNDIDFNLEHKIPNWDQIVDFAKYIGKNIPHHRLLALDIMIDTTGAPRLIEFNVDAYSMWLFQFAVGAALGEHTDEIIEYCKKNVDKAEKVIKA